MLSQRNLFTYRMEVQYVYSHFIDRNCPILRKLTEFCEYSDIVFVIREYDSEKHEEDRECVERLPAIQVYFEKEYYDTYYTPVNIVQILRLELNKYEIEKLEEEAKRQIWNEKIRYLKSKFHSLKTDCITSKRGRQ